MHGARKVPRELLDDKRESVGEQEGQAGGRRRIGFERRTCVGIKSVRRTADRNAILDDNCR